MTQTLEGYLERTAIDVSFTNQKISPEPPEPPELVVAAEAEIPAARSRLRFSIPSRPQTRRVERSFAVRSLSGP